MLTVHALRAACRECLCGDHASRSRPCAPAAALQPSIKEPRVNFVAHTCRSCMLLVHAVVREIPGNVRELHESTRHHPPLAQFYIAALPPGARRAPKPPHAWLQLTGVCLVQEANVEMNSLSAAARQILYQWPQVLNSLPAPIMAAARAAVDSGRAARSRVHTALQDIPTEL